MIFFFMGGKCLRKNDTFSKALGCGGGCGVGGCCGCIRSGGGSGGMQPYCKLMTKRKVKLNEITENTCCMAAGRIIKEKSSN